MPIARILANSVRLALPRMTAPAARSCFTTVASALARAPSSANEPAVVGCLSPVAILSFTRIGTPASGCAGRGLHAVELASDRERIGIELAHRVQRRACLVVGLDAGEVGAGQGARGRGPLGQRLLHLGERGVLDRNSHLCLRSSGGSDTQHQWEQGEVAAGRVSHGSNRHPQTGIWRFWCARPIRATSGLCPEITRTPSSSRWAIFSGVAPSRKASLFFWQAAKTLARAFSISGG